MGTEAGTASARVIARGVAAASLAVVPAAIAHGIADGHLVAPGTLALTILAASVACVRLVGRRAGRTRIAAAVLASQLLFHGIFLLAHLGASAGHASSAGHATAASLAGSPAHAGHDPGAATAALAGVSAADPAALAPDAGMMLAHLCAAAVTILGAWHGRSLCLRLARAGQRALVRLARLACPSLTPPIVVSAAPIAHEVPFPRAVPLRTRGIRGPPELVG